MLPFIHYLVFKEQFLERYDLSKPSKTFIASTILNTFFFLHRKEVIHPHVPVGIPCYDLTPIIGPTLDSSLDYSLSHRLRVLPTLMV